MAIRDDHRPSPKVNHDGKCEYFNKINKCRHLPKPEDCNMYPLYFLEDGLYIDKACPGWKNALTQFKKYTSRFKKEDIMSQGEYEIIWQQLPK